MSDYKTKPFLCPYADCELESCPYLKLHGFTDACRDQWGERCTSYERNKALHDAMIAERDVLLVDLVAQISALQKMADGLEDAYEEGFHDGHTEGYQGGYCDGYDSRAYGTTAKGGKGEQG